MARRPNPASHALWRDRDRESTLGCAEHRERFDAKHRKEGDAPGEAGSSRRERHAGRARPKWPK
jgi:hypothetical protein